MEIRRFADSDIRSVVALFYETVHSINKRDYTKEQLDAWAPKDERQLKLESWRLSLSSNMAYVAVINGGIAGFADMSRNGHLDRLYVSKDFQGRGVASALVDRLEAEARALKLGEIDTEASITARPFFERRGYRVVQPQQVERRGVLIRNFKMKKRLSYE